MTKASSLTKRRFDVVIVGAGGSGMRASLQLARAGLNVAVLSKVVSIILFTALLVILVMRFPPLLAAVVLTCWILNRLQRT